MSQAPLGSNAYLASNASEATLVDASSSVPGKQGISPRPDLPGSRLMRPGVQASPKLSLKSKLKNKLNGSQDPAQMRKREPTKSWEARAMALM
ncbi:hypothetical protein AK830_g3113 [Neonectria ditissima]|uniref:Uncharacterized protein n=1 Tax=Neonectria ditissima TaxID=78410 RepID=A0A0P7BPY1_9HYPO|nr:hypothetical protein AK830_g3113 [Neonectria ditissima]